MQSGKDTGSVSIPWFTWAVLVAAVVGHHFLDLALEIRQYRLWYEHGSELEPLSSHLLQSLRFSSFLTLVIVVGFLLAFRGRRWLFAAPALALFLVPPLVEVYHGASWAFPGLRGSFGAFAYEHGRWWYWVGAALNLTLAVAPGAVVARYISRTFQRGQTVAMAILAVPAWLAAWYGVLFFSYEGQLNPEVAGLYVAVFALGAAMGTDRPWWHWGVVVLGVWMVSIYGFLSGPELAVALACATLGVVSGPVGSALDRRGLAPWSPEPATS